MLRKALVWQILLASAGFAAAGPSTRLLGVDYSEWFTAPSRIAADASGALYLLGSYALPSPACGIQCSASSVTKLSADGTTILWQDLLGIVASAMAVSPSGDVFVVTVNQAVSAPDYPVYVAKLGSGGSGSAWTASAGFNTLPDTVPVLAADAQGRSYVAVVNTAGNAGTVVRINAAGAAIDYSATFTGTPASIAADGSGAVVVAGGTPYGGFVTRLAADGSVDYYTALPDDGWPAGLVLDAANNPVILGQTGPGALGLLQHLDASGKITVTTSVPGTGQLGMDAAGNAYVLGSIGQLYPVQNSISGCLPSTPQSGELESATPFGTAPLLTVVAPDGSISQVTYLPQAAIDPGAAVPSLVTGPDSTVYVLTSPAPGFAPTQQGPFPYVPPYPDNILLRLSPQSAAQPVSLACVGNAATYSIGPVAPGEIVDLMGSGLGPMQGIQTQATPQSPFAAQVSGVEVTFDGTPAPLLWVQNSQINAIVPWSLTPGTNTRICVSSGDASTNCLTWPVAQTAPGVFTVDGMHAAAVNQDGSVNSATNPAAPGSIVSVYATGLGPVSPAQADGSLVGFPLPANVIQTAVEALQIGISPPFGESVHSVPVTAPYAGPAAYLVAGTTQVNFQATSSAGFYLVPGGLTSSGFPASTTSQVFNIYVAGQ